MKKTKDYVEGFKWGWFYGTIVAGFIWMTLFYIITKWGS